MHKKYIHMQSSKCANFVSINVLHVTPRVLLNIPLHLHMIYTVIIISFTH